MEKAAKIAIFASGSGSNAQRIAEYFEEKGGLQISAIYCNKAGAYVLERAKMLAIPAVLFDRSTFYSTDEILQDIRNRGAEWIILAGFLWLIPDYLLKAFPNRIINIHPALLPAYGGKGMYGMKVHESVIDNQETESGITIHYVNEKYDEGQVIFQAKCLISAGETADSLAAKIHELEYEYFPEVISRLLESARNQE
jgi:phosphoribosylglycinamide formyltransferase-1